MKTAKKISLLRRPLFLLAFTFLPLVLLAGCGGGGGGSDSTTTPRTTTSGVSAGTIQGFGSVIINGVKFETPEGTEVEIEGRENETLSPSDLREGMVVEVEGSYNDDNPKTGTAALIRYDSQLEGPIASLTTNGVVKTLSVMGRTVIVENGVTQFDDTPPISFATLAAGQVIEVSGYDDGAGNLQATFIEQKADSQAAFEAANEQYEVKGVIANFSGSTFTLNNLNVDASGATLSGVLENGRFVEVKGSAFNVATSTLTAATVEVEDRGFGANVAKAEVEGIVSGLDAGSQTFMLLGQPVDYANATFRGGIEADLADGTRVEAEGPIDAGGTLVAVKITFKESVRIEGNAITIDTVGNTLTLEGLNLAVAIDGTLTRLVGLTSLADIVPGAEVKVRARLAAGDTLIATRLELIDNTQSANRTTLQGPVSSFDAAADQIVILGITVDTGMIAATDDSGASNFEIEDVPVTKAAFFAALQVGDIVKARADLPGLAWDQVEIEIED